MKRAALLTVACCLFGTLASAQTAPPCVIDTPAQRAIWDRMKADNHAWYQQIKRNTTVAVYGDGGRWELVAGLIDNDAALLRKAVVETLATIPVSKGAGDMIREIGTERAMQYGCLWPHMTAAERTTFETWLKGEAETILKQTLLNDSDQVIGNFNTLALTDKMLGTAYLSRTFSDGVTAKPVGGLKSTACDKSSMRNAICWYAGLARGGHWIEATAGYDLNTLPLLLMGAQWLGIENFPEVKALIPDLAHWIANFVTPDLKDVMQSGDNEHPHDLRLDTHFSNMLSFLAAWSGDADIAARLRQLEIDIYAANGRTGPTPLYARYYYTADPYAPKQAWREWAGTSHYGAGQGHLYVRTGTTAAARETWIHCPTFRNGVVDHWGGDGFCDVRHYRPGKNMVLDRPLGYAPDQIYANSFLVGARTAPGTESNDVVGYAVVPGKIAFFAGLEAGQTGTHTTFPYYGKVKPFLHERGRRMFDILDGEASTIVLIDTVQADDPRTLVDGTVTYAQMYAYAYQQNAVKAVPKITEWLTQTPVQPTFSEDRMRFSWAAGPSMAQMQQVLPRTALDREVVDEKAMYCPNSPLPAAERNVSNCFGGNMNQAQLKYLVRATPQAHQPWAVYAHVFSATETGELPVGQAVESTEGDAVVGVRIVRAGRDVAVLVSGKPGPKQAGSYEKTQWGSFNTIADRTRVDKVVAARRLTDVRLTLEEDVDVYLADLDPSISTITVNGKPTMVVRNGDLASFSVLAEPPPPALSEAQKLIQEIRGRIDALHSDLDTLSGLVK